MLLSHRQETISAKADSAAVNDINQQLADFMQRSDSQLSRLEASDGGSGRVEKRIQLLRDEMKRQLALDIEESLHRQRMLDATNPNDPGKVR